MHDSRAERTLTTYCDAGLCNRLRVLLSGMALAEASGRQFMMVWTMNNRCNCRFEDLFHNSFFVVEDDQKRPKDLIIFGKYHGRAHPTFDILNDLRTHLAVISTGWLVNPGLFVHHKPLQDRCRQLWLDFKPDDVIMQKVIEFKQQHFREPTLGVHLRRGDYLRCCPERTHNMSEAMKAMVDFIRQFPQGRIFLSTDDSAIDPSTRKVHFQGIKQELKAQFGETIVFTTPRSMDRNTPEAIQDGLIDLLLLRETNYFIGTRGSSFSEFAVLGRQIPFVFYPRVKLEKRVNWYVRRVGFFLKKYFHLAYHVLKG